MRAFLSRLPSPRWWVTILGTLPASLAVGVAGYYHHIGIGAAVAALWVLGLAYFNWPERHNRTALEETLSALPAYLGLPDTADVRCAIYVPVAGSLEEHLRCVTNYMPEGRRRVGYRLPTSKGIIGKAYRFAETRVDILDDPKYDNPQEFRRYMMDLYGFTEAEARELRADRRAYLASPVLAPGNIKLGIIYMDTNQADAFSAELAQQVEALAPFFHQLLRLKGG
jgi:hypothetical protein